MVLIEGTQFMVIITQDAKLIDQKPYPFFFVYDDYLDAVAAVKASKNEGILISIECTDEDI